MAIVKARYNVDVPVFLLPAIVNGDTSGFTRPDEDEAALNAYYLWVARTETREAAKHSTLNLPDGLDDATALKWNQFTGNAAQVLCTELVVWWDVDDLSDRLGRGERFKHEGYMPGYEAAPVVVEAGKDERPRVVKPDPSGFTVRVVENPKGWNIAQPIRAEFNDARSAAEYYARMVNSIDEVE